MSDQPTRKIYVSKDAAPVVLHGKRENTSDVTYPMIVDRHGGLRSTAAPTNQQLRIEYNSDSTQKYIGTNDQGKDETTDEDWLLHYLEYDSKRRIIKRTIAYDSWTNRLTADYT